MIHKKALSKILGQEIKAVAQKYYENRVYYKLFNNNDVFNEKRRYINKYELINLCREYIHKNSTYVTESHLAKEGYILHLTSTHPDGVDILMPCEPFTACWKEDEFYFSEELDAYSEAILTLIEVKGFRKVE